LGESLSLVNQEMLFCFSVALAGVKFNTLENLRAKWLFHTIWSQCMQYTSSKIVGTWVLGLEWPSPHDYSRSVQDELVFIPVIEPLAVKEVESKKKFTRPLIVFFFSPHTAPAQPIIPFTHLPHSFCNGKTYISSWLNFSD
jgi:hypothetical protein